MTVQVVRADVLDWASTYNGPPFHAILTDPPYELGFMGKSWDASGVAFQSATWAALAVHLLPGAHVLAFGGSRTHHRLMCAMEDAGLEIRDCIYWAFGSGFPKSLNVGKAIDKAAGAEREVVRYEHPADRLDGSHRGDYSKRFNGNAYNGGEEGGSRLAPITAPATPAAATWEGYGTALKPAVEVIVMARKPIEGTVAANCERYGSGALAIDKTRIPGANGDGHWIESRQCEFNNPSSGRYETGRDNGNTNPAAGRWPANLVLSHLPGCKRVGTKRVKGSYLDHECTKDSNVYGAYGTERRQGYTDPNGLETVDAWECAPGCPTQLFPVTTSGERKKGSLYHNAKEITMGKASWYLDKDFPADSGSAARFFFQATWELDQAEQLDAADVLRYAAKASRAERDAGLDSFEAMQIPQAFTSEVCVDGRSGRNAHERQPIKLRNHHPTVKPLSLCRYLATLLLPPAARAPRRILVPFGGVASEAIGAMLAGWDEVVGVELTPEYIPIAEARVAYWQGKMDKQIALPLEVLA